MLAGARAGGDAFSPCVGAVGSLRMRRSGGRGQVLRLARGGGAHLGPPRRCGSLATAAALCFVASSPRDTTDPAAREPALMLAARASELDPQSAAIGWLRLQLCANSAGCDIREAATTLRWVDADNGAVWLPTLAAAQKDKDPARDRSHPFGHGPGLAIRLLLESDRRASIRHLEARAHLARRRTTFLRISRG